MIARSEAAQAPASTMSNGVTGNIPECDCTRLARAIRAGAQRQEAAGHARAPARPAARARVPPAPRRGSRSHLVGRVGRASLNAARRLSRAKSTTQARGANREVLRSRAVTTRRMSGASRGLIFSEPKPVLDTDRHRRIGNPKQKLIHGRDGGSYNILKYYSGVIVGNPGILQTKTVWTARRPLPKGWSMSQHLLGALAMLPARCFSHQ